MAWTQADIIALEKAYAIGALKVKYGNNEIIYRSLAEMKQLLDDMRKQVHGASNYRTMATKVYSKGL